MKRFVATRGLLLAGFFVSTLYIAAPVAHAGAPSRMSGDVNCDHEVDLGDVVFSLNWLFRGGPAPCEVPDSPELVDRITELEREAGECDAENARLQEELQSARAALVGTEEVLAATQARLQQTQDSLLEAQAALTTCTEDLTTASDDLVTCGDDLDSVETARDNCEGALVDAESRIEELEVFARPGCIDANAVNYDLCADVDDGSCQYRGCTDPTAANFDPVANVDDGSCQYPGCTNPDADNYDPQANVDDGSCEISGCTDPEASNYNSAANLDDGSCEYRGCTDPGALNYDPVARMDDGSCEYVIGVPDGFTFLEVNAQGYQVYTHDQTGIVVVKVPGSQTVDPFLIGRYEVTQAQYAAVMAGHESLSPDPSAFDGTTDFDGVPIDSPFDGDRLPVEQVSWHDILAEDGFLARTGFELPWTAMWEYACRAGTTTQFSWGDDCFAAANTFCATADVYMWYAGNAGRSTHPVGEKLPNPFGLHDMHGNVREWCFEATGPGDIKGFRGGGWRDDASVSRSANRGEASTGARDVNQGFRVVRPLR